MARYHILTTITKDKTAHLTPPMSDLHHILARAGTAGDPKHCQEQILRVYEGQHPHGKIVDVMARISHGDSWSAWAQDQRWYNRLA